MRLKDFLAYYDVNGIDRLFRSDLVEMVSEEVEDARLTGLRMGRIQRESEIKSKLLSALLKEDV